MLGYWKVLAVLLPLLQNVLSVNIRLSECDDMCSVGDGRVNECCTRLLFSLTRGYCNNGGAYCKKRGKQEPN